MIKLRLRSPINGSVFIFVWQQRKRKRKCKLREKLKIIIFFLTSIKTLRRNEMCFVRGNVWPLTVGRESERKNKLELRIEERWLKFKAQTLKTHKFMQIRVGKHWNIHKHSSSLEHLFAFNLFIGFGSLACHKCFVHEKLERKTFGRLCHFMSEIKLLFLNLFRFFWHNHAHYALKQHKQPK